MSHKYKLKTVSEVDANIMDEISSDPKRKPGLLTDYNLEYLMDQIVEDINNGEFNLAKSSIHLHILSLCNEFYPGGVTSKEYTIHFQSLLGFLNVTTKYPVGLRIALLGNIQRF